MKTQMTEKELGDRIDRLAEEASLLADILDGAIHEENAESITVLKIFREVNSASSYTMEWNRPGKSSFHIDIYP